MGESVQARVERGARIAGEKATLEEKLSADMLRVESR